MKIIEIKNDRPKHLRIIYDLGNICNYKCWYCFPGANEGTTRWPDVDVVKHNMVNVINHYIDNGIDDIQLTFIGGEPTLWPKFGEFVEHVSKHSKKKVKISAHTNASRTLRWWEEYGEYFDHAYLSVHHERVDLDHIISVAEILMSKKVLVSAAVIMDHMAWDKCINNLNYLLESKSQFIVYAKPIYIDGKTNYNEEQQKFLEHDMKRGPATEDIEWIKAKFTTPLNIAVLDDGSTFNINSDHWLMMNDLNHFKGWECTLGVNLINILRDGSIAGFCGVKLFDKNYNLNDPNLNFNVELKPVICTKDYCENAAEMLLSKKCIN